MSILIVLFSWLLAAGCSGAKNAPAYYDMPPSTSAGPGGGGYGGYRGDEAQPIAREEMDYEYEYEPIAEDSSSRGSRIALAPRKAPPPSPPPPPPSTATIVTSPQPEPEPAVTTPTPEAPARMVHYDGWMQIRVANPRETLEAAVTLTAEMGGRTERMSGNTVTLRIPVERFEEGFAALLALGDVMNKSIRADDVTEAYTAIDLRANTLRATQKRLIALIARAKDEAEKLKLLAELTRVTTELDAIESQLRTLSDLAAMSRITLEAYPREAFQAQGGRPTLDGFAWIAALSPFRRAIWEDDHRIALPVPDGLVSLSNRGPFVAESADGTVLWTMRLPNDPVGSGPFWLASIQDRLASEFVEPQPSRVRAWECLSLLEPGAEEPYRWQICVKPDGNKLHVAQVFYPGKAQFDRYGAAIEAALSAGGES